MLPIKSLKYCGFSFIAAAIFIVFLIYYKEHLFIMLICPLVMFISGVSFIWLSGLDDRIDNESKEQSNNLQDSPCNTETKTYL